KVVLIPTWPRPARLRLRSVSPACERAIDFAKSTMSPIRTLVCGGRRLSQRRLSRSPGRGSGPPFVGVIERADLGVAEQPGERLDRHAVIGQVTSGKALS